MTTTTAPPAAGNICWPGDPGKFMPGRDMLISYGRCRSGKRWFWCAAYYGRLAPETERHGWEPTEDQAVTAARAAVAEIAAGRPAHVTTAAKYAAGALKRVNAGKRRARPPSPDRDTRPVEYLYAPWSYTSDYGTRSTGIDEIPIVKKTPKRIYYDNTDRWDKDDGIVTLGFIDREEFETDTRCKDDCTRNIPGAPVCAPHGRDFTHCVHFGQGWRAQNHQCWMPPGCADTCPLDTNGTKCGKHGYTWPHCPHGEESPDGCRHGSPAGQGGVPGRRWWSHRWDFFATREAALASLQTAEAAEPADLRQLRMAMADAHPDRGGTAEEFMAARQRYKQALARQYTR